MKLTNLGYRKSGAALFLLWCVDSVGVEKTVRAIFCDKFHSFSGVNLNYSTLSALKRGMFTRSTPSPPLTLPTFPNKNRLRAG